jgi:phenylacetate-CoA ligase
MLAGGEECLTRPALEKVQRQHLRALLDALLPGNRFYAEKIKQAGLPADKLHLPEYFSRLPFTTKSELIADQRDKPPYGSNLTFPLAHYTRLHQTSGTSGQPLRWLDTNATWEWMLGCWQQVYRAARVEPGDRIFFAFSFGPFLGFWTAFEAATRYGCLALAGGGMTSLARLRFLIDNCATAVVCTPTYALRLCEAARENGIALSRQTAGYAVRAVIVGGEPGGGIPATRRRIEEGWQARLFDQSGMTEIGPATCECFENPGGLHLLEGDFIGEVIDPATGQPLTPGSVGELVLTNLGRAGSPLLRYRTGDLVRIDPRPCPCGRAFLRLDGGILGRTDDMIHVRGNNLYPSSLEAVIQRFAEVAEYRVVIAQREEMAEVKIVVEPVAGSAADHLAERLAQTIRQELLFRVEVELVAAGTLPRFEMKAKRIVREGHEDPRI